MPVAGGKVKEARVVVERLDLKDVPLAVSRIGRCDVSLIKVGEIRQDRSGLGTAWVSCPIMAAKKVSGSRLLVDFVSA